MAREEDDSPVVLLARLEELRGSLDELTETLKADPTNEELQKLRRDVLEVIAVTEASLRSLSQGPADKTPPAAAAASPAAVSPVAARPAAAGGGAASPPAPPAPLAVGEKVFALYSGDGLWYEAEVSKTQPGGGAVTVTFVGYGNSEAVAAADVRRHDGHVTLAQLNEGKTAESKKRTSAAWESSAKEAAAPSKKIAKPAPKPKKEDPTVQAWKQFATKATKMKAGTGVPKRKESIFRTPEAPEAKVGVTGSGKPMTKYTEVRQKWDKLKDPNALNANAEPEADE